MQQLIATNPNAAQLLPETLAQLQQVKSVVAGVGVDDAGLRLKAIAKLDPKAIKAEYKSSSGKMAAQFPSETIASRYRTRNQQYMVSFYRADKN